MNHAYRDEKGSEGLRRATGQRPNEVQSRAVMPDHIFYSWQSDVEPGAACRSFIQGALEKAIERIAKDLEVDEAPRLDHDTKGVPGSPGIGAIVLGKVDKARAFIADVTIVGTTLKGKPTPNPNVLVELGYALKALGPDRIIMVMNEAIGGAADQLPFDLRQKKTVMYSSAPDATERATAKKILADRLEAELRAILSQAKAPDVVKDVTLTVARRDVAITSNVHNYELVMSITNVSERRITDWEVVLEFPTPFLTAIHYSGKSEARSNAKRTVLVWPSSKMAEPLLRPDETRSIKIEYLVTNALYERRDELFGELVKVTASVDGRILQRFEKPIEELQKF